MAENYTPLDMNRLQASYTPSKRSNVLFSSLSVVALLVVSLFGTMFYSFTVSKNELTKMKSEAAGTTHTKLQTRKTVTFGTDATFPPMESTDPQGALIGYDIDLGTKIGQQMGVKVVFRNITWDDLFTALESNKVDAVISGVTITDERRQKYLFSDPYLNAGQVIVTNTSDAVIHTVDDLRDKKVGVQKDTTNEKEALKYTSPTKVLSYADFEEAAKALIAKKIDAVILDLPAAKGIIDKNPGLKIASDPFTSEYYGITFNKNNPALKEEVNDALTKLQQQGILTDLKHKWFE